MRTSALAAVLVATTALAQAPSRLEWGIGPEVTLIGLTWGARPELLVRLGEPGSVSRLRFAVGVFAGRDQVFVPVSLGYRAVFRQHATLQPMVGLGLEQQNRSVPDLPVVRQLGGYLEGGLGVVLAPGVSLGLAVSLDVMVLGGPGVGLGPRLVLGWAPP
jgi:hypothetical protein